jgi:hypothetical protein
MTANIDTAASDIRELTADEISDVAGALRVEFGRFYLAVNEMDTRFTFGIKGGNNWNVTLFNDGDLCARADGFGSRCF